MDVYGKLKELGLTLPEAPAKGGVYTPCKLTEDGYAYISGCGPVIGGVQAAGKLGQEYSVEEGQKFAQNCMLNVLAVLEKKIGDLNRVADVVKILVFVASADDFYSQPQVANGASNLLVSLFGEDAGAPTRSAVGMNVLPAISLLRSRPFSRSSDSFRRGKGAVKCRPGILDSFQIVVALYLFYIAFKGSGQMYRFGDMDEETQQQIRTPLRLLYAAAA